MTAVFDDTFKYNLIITIFRLENSSNDRIRFNSIITIIQLCFVPTARRIIY